MHVLTKWFISFLYVFFTNVRKRAGLYDRCYVHMYLRFCQTGYMIYFKFIVMNFLKNKQTRPDEIPVA